jgi:hypothetical protein
MCCTNERAAAPHDKNDFIHKNAYKSNLKVIEVNKSSELHLKLLEKAAHQNTVTSHLAVSGESRELNAWYDHEFPPVKKSLFVKKKMFNLSNFPTFLQSNGLKKAKYWLRPSEINFSNVEYDEEDEEYSSNNKNEDENENLPRNTNSTNKIKNNTDNQNRFLPISLYSNSSSVDVLQGGLGSCKFRFKKKASLTF